VTNLLEGKKNIYIFEIVLLLWRAALPCRVRAPVMYQKLCTKVKLCPSDSGSHSLGLILSKPYIRIGLSFGCIERSEAERNLLVSIITAHPS
jgi:hypothetical protein